jgi:thioesterase domain-containing protein
MLPSDYRVATSRVLPSGKTERIESELLRQEPSSPIESEVLDVLRAALAPVAIEPEEDFYDKGGHSLLALRVLAELERRLMRRLELIDFNTAPNARALAARLATAPLVDESMLVDITTTISGPAAFFIPGGHGGDAEFALYRTAFKDLPMRLIGVRVVDIDADSLAERAKHLAALLRRHSPTGPFRLIGECIGGVLAQEVARQLGGRPRLLLLDAWPMTEAGVRHYRERVLPRVLRRERMRLRWLAAIDLVRVAVDHIDRRLMHRRYRHDVALTLNRVFRDWRRAIALVGTPQPHESRGAAIPEQALAHRTMPGPPLTLVAPAGSRRHRVIDAWSPLAQVRELPVPGTHDSYLRRHAAATRNAITTWWVECEN